MKTADNSTVSEDGAAAPELADRPARPRARPAPRAFVRPAVIIALLLFVLLAVPSIFSVYYVDAWTQVAIYSIVALGLGLLVGRVGMVSLGQGAVLAMGAWVAARLLFATALPFPIVLLVAGADHDGAGHAGRAPGAADERSVPAASINITLYKLWAFALASFVTGVAGGLVAGSFRYLNSLTFSTQDSITLLAVVLMGGAYSIWGAIVAAILLKFLAALLNNWGVSRDWLLILFGIGVLQVLTTAPRGIVEQLPKDLARLARLLRGLSGRTAAAGGRTE